MNWKHPAVAKTTIMAAAGLILSACTLYKANPLTAQEDWQNSPVTVTRIVVDSKILRLPPLPPHRFGAEAGLDMTDIATLAVVNNPDLRLARDDLAIAQAQAFDAGLLPDPQLGFLQNWTAPHVSGSTPGYTYGLNFDVMKMLSRGANRDAAQATARKVDLGLLWQEWQLVSQAKVLYLKNQLREATLPKLTRQRDLNLTRYQAMQQAMDQHQLTGDALGVALLAYQDSQTALGDALRAAEQNRHDLNALLGLKPDAQLKLRSDDGLNDEALAREVNENIAKAETSLERMPSRRPDLLALKAGYDAQEARYRVAIINQFPAFVIGPMRARDNSNVDTTGFQGTISLPIFNGNRGVVSIEKATRQRLRDEYHIRVEQAYSDIHRLREDTRLLSAQLQTIRSAMPGLNATADAARQAYQEHNLAIGAYTDAETAVLTRDIAIATTQELLAEQNVALQALLGAPLPESFVSQPNTAGGENTHVD